MSGNVVIACKWVEALDFSEGLAGVKGRDEKSLGYQKWGYIDTKGNVVIPFTWDFADNFVNGLAKVQNRNSNLLTIDKTGKITE